MNFSLEFTDKSLPRFQSCIFTQGKPACFGPFPDDLWMAEYDRRKRAMMFEALRNSNHVPFTKWCIVTPYEYRAFDLTLGEKPNAILITDIPHVDLSGRKWPGQLLCRVSKSLHQETFPHGLNHIVRFQEF